MVAADRDSYVGCREVGLVLLLDLPYWVAAAGVNAMIYAFYLQVYRVIPCIGMLMMILCWELLANHFAVLIVILKRWMNFIIYNWTEILSHTYHYHYAVEMDLCSPTFVLSLVSSGLTPILECDNLIRIYYRFCSRRRFCRDNWKINWFGLEVRWRRWVHCISVYETT